MSNGFQEHRARVRARISQAASDCGRVPSEITLVCVSKTFDTASILPALEAGERVFGENRVQEAQKKWPSLKAQFSGIELHLLGPLQSNKVKEAVALFDVIETVDRPKIAEALAQEMSRCGRRPELFVQINTGSEPQKSGIEPRDAEQFVIWCREELRLQISGLMCIPPENEQRSPHFAMLASIAKRLSIPSLSMGMSADFEWAIQLGATHVRVGTALFGPRD